MDQLVRNPKIINEKFREYFFPTVLISLANNLAVIVDSIMVGNILGSNAMAAIQLLSPITQLYFALTVLFGLGTSTLISLAMAKREKKEANSILTVAFVSITILIIVLMLFQFLFLNQIVRFLTTLENMEELILAYYIPFIIGTPFQLYLSSFIYCIRSDGRPKFASNLIILSNIINLGLDYVFMAILNFGIAGSAIATVVGNVTSFILMLSQFWYKENSLHFNFKICTKVFEFFKDLSSLLSTGLAGAFATLLVTLRVFFLNHMVQYYGGNDGIVAMSVASMGLILVSSFVMGACQTMVPLISTFYAQKDNKSVIYTFKRTILYMMGILIIIIILMEIFPSAFALIFGKKSGSELVETNIALRITTLSYPGMGLTFLFLYYFTAVQRNTMSLILSFANGLLSVPVAFAFSYFIGLNGVWDGILLAQYLTLVLAIIMLVNKKFKAKDKYTGLLLLEPNEKEIINFTLNSNYSEEKLEISLKEIPELKDKVPLVTSIITCIKNQKDSNFDTDIRILNDEPDLIINCRTNHQNINLDNLENLDLKKIETDKVLGMNEIKILL